MHISSETWWKEEAGADQSFLSAPLKQTLETCISQHHTGYLAISRWLDWSCDDTWPEAVLHMHTYPPFNPRWSPPSGHKSMSQLLAPSCETVEKLPALALLSDRFEASATGRYLNARPSHFTNARFGLLWSLKDTSFVVREGHVLWWMQPLNRDITTVSYRGDQKTFLFWVYDNINRNNSSLQHLRKIHCHVHGRWKTHVDRPFDTMDTK